MANLFDGVRAVLFDMDGTLVETNIDFPLMRREVLALGGKYGIPDCDLEGLDILSAVDLIDARLRETSRDEAVKARQEALEKLEQIELAHSEGSRPIDGAHDVLRALREVGLKTAIVTRNCRAAVELSLEITGIFADVLLTRDDVRKTKPHPEHLVMALDMLEVRPHQAVTVGDHWMDVQGGKAAGTRTVGFLRPDRPEDFFDREQPDFVIRGLAELLDPIARLKK
ncbi:MAG: HAD family hydrolase [Armatimonadetes bacterium]|nr:HAD family hydrolase [Armatimonadota bacterium]